MRKFLRKLRHRKRTTECCPDFAAFCKAIASPPKKVS